MKAIERFVKYLLSLNLDAESREASRYSRRAEIIKSMNKRKSAEELKAELDRNKFEEECG